MKLNWTDHVPDMDHDLSISENIRRIWIFSITLQRLTNEKPDTKNAVT